MHWLPIATAVYNNQRNSTTKLAPNQALLGYHPTIRPEQNPENPSQSAQKRIELLRKYQDEAKRALNAAAESKELEPQYAVNQQVWLETTNLRIPQKSKLSPRRVGPFRITKQILPVAYQLDLPPSWTLHNVFHASLLHQYNETTEHGPNFSRPPPDLIEAAEEYEVENILDHRYQGRGRQLQYLVHWKGYPTSDDTWEPAHNLRSLQLLWEYHKRRPLTSIKTNCLSSCRPTNLSLPSKLSCPTLRSSTSKTTPPQTPALPELPQNTLNPSPCTPPRIFHLRASTDTSTTSCPPPTQPGQSNNRLGEQHP